MSRLCTAFAVLALLVACRSEEEDVFVERSTRVVFEPDGTGFWSVPLPSELRRQDDGSYNLERWPGDRPQLVKMWLEAIDARVRGGWGVDAGAFFTLSGDVDAASLPATPEASLAHDASVQLVDIDPASPEYGRRFPLRVQYTSEPVPYRPAKLLALAPVQGFARRPNTLYAAIITDAVRDVAGEPLGGSRAFYDALRTSGDAQTKAADALAPLRAFLEKEAWAKRRVVGATVFRTLDPSAALVKLAAWVETLPKPTLLEPWTKLAEYDDFTQYVAAYEVPKVQAGAVPGKGRIVWNEAGDAPVQQGAQRVRLSISIPRVAAPAAGFPLMLYLHGSGGEYEEAMHRGPLPQTDTRDKLGDAPKGSGPSAWLGRRGVAILGFDFPLHGDRDTPPDTTGLKLYDLFGDIDTTIDNMQVSAMEVVYLTRLVEGMTVPLEGGGEASFDVTRLSAMGHSMGSTIGIPTATVAKRVQGWVFSGSGGLLLEVGTTATYPVELGPTLELLLGFSSGQRLDAMHPMLNAFQALWDFVDPTAKGRNVAQEPLPGMTPRPFFMPHGVIDGYFHPGAQTAVAVALGGAMAGEPVDAYEPEAMRLRGQAVGAAYPLKGNLNGVTAGVTHRSAPFELGHYITFDDAAVSAQLTCFVLGVGTAEGPSLVAPGGTCP